MANVPADLRYTREHEWAKREADRVRVGITDFAQEQLGDVVFVELPKVGAKVTAHQAFGVVTNAQDFMHVLRFYVERWQQSPTPALSSR